MSACVRIACVRSACRGGTINRLVFTERQRHLGRGKQSRMTAFEALISRRESIDGAE